MIDSPIEATILVTHRGQEYLDHLEPDHGRRGHRRGGSQRRAHAVRLQDFREDPPHRMSPLAARLADHLDEVVSGALDEGDPS